jgi:hypothetical protein
MRVDVGDISAPAKDGQQVADAAVGVRAAFAPKHRSLGQNGSNGAQGVPHRGVQGDQACLISLPLPYRRPSRAGLQHYIGPRQADEFVDSQPRIQERGDDGVHHGSGSFSFAAEPLAFDSGKPLGCQRLAGDGLELGCGVRLHAAGIPSPAIEALQGSECRVDGCWLLPDGESSAILAQVMAGGVDQVGTVLLAQPDGEAVEVAQVEPRRPGGDLLLGEEGQEGSHHIIGGTQEGLWPIG